MRKDSEELELSIVMPCLNEEETIGICIQKAKKYLDKTKISGEVLIVDNGSTDRSVEISQKMGARVVKEENKGYGNALIKGTNSAKGKYVIMGDSDDSYNFEELDDFMIKLNEGYDLVMGNRFSGKIEKGAMSFSHRYIGNPILSGIAGILYKTKIGDFHCGLRGYLRKSILDLNLKSPGMEYASEMVVEAVRNNLKITEIPITLYKDGRTKRSHLRTIRDGIRHLIYLLKNLNN